jgi:hypothetical protein|tara:strand:+ start:56 stop:208 length:153 start_codon:yes stop_codon:yes gene_type:complete
MEISDWTIEIVFHLPHDRFMVGWDVIQPTKEYNYRTVSISLFIITLTIDF